MEKRKNLTLENAVWKKTKNFEYLKPGSMPGDWKTFDDVVGGFVEKFETLRGDEKKVWWISSEGSHERICVIGEFLALICSEKWSEVE